MVIGLSTRPYSPTWKRLFERVTPLDVPVGTVVDVYHLSEDL